MRKCVEEPFFVHHLKNELKPILSSRQEVVFVCIGTDRSSGDSYGPFVGSKLKQSFLLRTYTHVSIYGCLDHPVHAKNLAETVQTIEAAHVNPIVIAVDACLGAAQNIGTVVLDLGPMKPGAGVQKDLPPIGHYHISGIVNVSGFLPLQVLQGTRLALVYKMANKTADFITRALVELEYEKKKTAAV
ncbi:spore protease YyaC [Domibacillus enclensis]|uniref:Putative sporulation protein YyaC n=1 Tax=Domibacillus enclensis TaxID=1017273 RepID=A0A1N7ASE4_9BACI|nr:spore protease YyaC [Domibacillus enclensis]OXS75066.1 spore protease YyaC [Domibacillus enclensis]SIR42049.1 putative sporulation protein YyaC [Domibacillus enclensis]